MANHKKYCIHLTDEERAASAEVTTGKRSRLKIATWKVQRANVMLKCDESENGPAWTDEQLSEAFGTTTRSIEYWRKKACEEGPLYADVELITVVLDNLSTHTIASFYQAFDPAEALRLSQRIQLVNTPKHGSWLNMAEPELSGLTRQSLGDRIASEADVITRASAWESHRNSVQTGINWQFSTENARVKLRRLYTKFED